MNSAIYIATPEETDFQNFIRVLEIFGTDKIFHIKTPDDILSSPPATPPCVGLIDGRTDASLTLEWTQTLRMTYKDIPLIVFHQSSTALDIGLLKKNGANYLMHYNFDQEFIVDLILTETKWDFGSNLPLLTLQPLYPEEINEEQVLDFDLYAHLPHNNRTVQLRRKGDVLRKDTLKKVSDHGQNVYFRKTDQQEVMAALGDSKLAGGAEGTMAGTFEELSSKKRFYEFMAEFFDPSSDYESGKRIYEYCRKIVSDLGLLTTKPTEVWRDVLKRRCGKERSFYEEALNMAHYSAIFAQLTGMMPGQVESLALAGLLHNIGLSRIPNFSLQTDLATLTDEQKLRYRTYPDTSSAMIKNKKVPLPPAVNDIILQQCEKTDGSGFPNGLPKDKLHELTPIFHIAARFQQLTCLEERGTKRVPLEALKLLHEGALAGQELLDFTKTSQLLKKLQG